MQTNHEDSATWQLDYWVYRCEFPPTGSFSLRQLQQLKERLIEKERESQNKKNKKKFDSWVNEAQSRARKILICVSVRYLEDKLEQQPTEGTYIKLPQKIMLTCQHRHFLLTTSMSHS